MNSRSERIFQELVTRLEKPCSACKQKIRMSEIKLDGLGEPLDDSKDPVLYFTHKKCRSTMIAKTMLKKKTA